ncbi:MAG: site-2 protease family protein [Puniceicoccales bacterium]|jgi:RIP metalloprotease RseP|nr:site-2 protease family protein [Puniceicoccales bacterium]
MNLPNFGNILGSAFGVFLIVLFFGGSVFIHELGHFLAARWRGLKVERFSIGFGPRIWGWTGKDGVDYRISLLPLGGYVALPQLADLESIEGEYDNEAERLPPISYADKVIAASMGVIFNVLFALAIGSVLWVVGRPILRNSATTTIGFVASELDTPSKPSPAKAAGLQPGDKILTIDDVPVANFMQVIEKIALGSGRDDKGRPQVKLTIERNGQKRDILANPELIEINPISGDSSRRIGISPANEIVIETPRKGTPAATAGLKQGDTLIALNGSPLYSIEHLSQSLDAIGEKEIKLDVRDTAGALRSVTLIPALRQTTVELARITFTERDVERHLRLVAVPDDYNAPKPTGPHRNLMVIDTLPTSSQHSSTLRPGTILARIDQPDGIFSIHTPEELARASQRLKGDNATLFCKNNDGQETLTLKDFKASVIPPASHPYIGVTTIAKVEIVHQNPITQLGVAFKMTYDSLSALINRNSDVGVDQLMGIISIARTYYSNADDLRRILWFTLIINISLAILNILPIPVLDGGHILIATVQKITGKPIPLKFLAALQYVCILLFIALMAYVVLYKDIGRWRGDNLLEQRHAIIQKYVVAPESPEKQADTEPATP